MFIECRYCLAFVKMYITFVLWSYLFYYFADEVCINIWYRLLQSWMIIPSIAKFISNYYKETWASFYSWPQMKVCEESSNADKQVRRKRSPNTLTIQPIYDQWIKYKAKIVFQFNKQNQRKKIAIQHYSEYTVKSHFESMEL